MPEEHTVSSITNMNTANRGNQKAATIIAMTQIRQKLLRDQGKEEVIGFHSSAFRN
jgi:hypothetical protein